MRVRTPVFVLGLSWGHLQLTEPEISNVSAQQLGEMMESTSGSICLMLIFSMYMLRGGELSGYHL